MSPDDLQQLTKLMQQLNGLARIIHSSEGRVPLDQVLDTGLFSMSEAEQQPEWLAVPRGQESTETEEYGITSFVFQSRRPFHPQRLSDAIDASFQEGIFNAMNESNIRQILEQCLLTDLEFVQGPDNWKQLPDPFPVVTQQDDEAEF